MRAQHRILSVAATIALLAAASPAFAQVYVGGDGPTVEVNLEALNSLPQTGPVKARAVRLRHPTALRQANHQVIQYDSQLETTVIGGNGEQLAQISNIKPLSGRIVRTTTSALAAPPVDPGVTQVALRPDGTESTPVHRKARRHHRHVAMRCPEPPADSLSLISGNPALKAHLDPAEMSADDLNYLQRVCALEPRPPSSPLTATPISAMEAPAPASAPAEDSSAPQEPEQHAELDAAPPPTAPEPSSPEPVKPDPKPILMASNTDAHADEVAPPPVAAAPPTPAPGPASATASDDVAPPPSKPKRGRRQAAANATPQPTASADPNAPVETQGHATIPGEETITPVQPSGPMVLDRADAVEANRPVPPVPVGIPPAPTVASMPVAPETTVDTGAVVHAPVEQTASASTDAQTVLDNPGAPGPASGGTSQGELRIDYRPGSQTLPTNGTARMDDLAQRLQNNADLRVELRSYASGGPGGTSKARRLSLSRALAVRAYLTGHGVDANRIDIRALGADPTQPVADRVDFFLMR